MFRRKLKSKLSVLLIGTSLMFVLSGQIENARAIISNGANAIDLLGQYDGTSVIDPQPIYTKGGVHDGPNRLGFDNPYAVEMDIVNNRLFVSDQNNNRVLVYNLSVGNLLIDRVPDFVLGQPNFASNSAATTQAGMNLPSGLAYDSINQRLFVAQIGSNRVTVYDVATITNGENAVNVIGQANFTGSGAAITQAGLSTPRHLVYDAIGQRLFVAQGTGVNRVTVYDVAAITDGENAINVLGQINFTDNGVATTQSGLSTPIGLAYDSAGQRLFVTDAGNNRVMVYDVNGITDGENAINVLGQTDFITSTGATNQSSTAGFTSGAVYDAVGQRLFVSQRNNNRITVFDVAGITDGENAINVLGQATYVSQAPAVTQAGMDDPLGMYYDSGNQNLYVAQEAYNRISVFEVGSITNGEAAIDLLGQYDGTNLSDPQPLYTKNGANDSPNRYGFNSSSAVVMDSVGHRLFVADQLNHRVLIYNLNTDNTFVDRIPDFVLGQPNFVSNTAATTQGGMSQPSGLAFDLAGQRLFVAQVGNHRVTVYDVATITNGENAINVLGQANFTASGSATTQAGMNAPRQIAYDSAGQRLFVPQSGNHRVTVYDVATISNGENAVNVIGQINFTGNGFITTQAGMSMPYGAAFDAAGQRLFVANTGNNRVTVYDVTTIMDGEDATHVLGQVNFTSGTAAATQTGMNAPRHLAYDPINQRLFVVLFNSDRVTVYDVATIVNGEGAVNVLGQADFTSQVTATTQSGLAQPQGLEYDTTSGRLFVTQLISNRISIFDAAFAGFQVIESDGNTAVVEGGPVDSFEVALTAIPNSDVVFNITSGNPLLLGVSLASLTFTNLNWNVPQSVDVSGLQDDDAVDELVNVTVSVDDALSDDSWDVLSDFLIPVTINDDDIPGFTIDDIVSPIVLNEGDTDTFEVYLDVEPSSDVVVLVSSNLPGSVSVDFASLTFTNANWNVPQIVTITAEEDLNSDNESATITLSVDDGLSDPDFAGVIDQQIIVDTVDNDPPPDVTAPIIAEVTAVASPTNDSSPDYTFSTDEMGTITYGGSCSSVTTVANVGNNTITFNALADGIYNNCTITVTDAALNVSNTLNISAFTIQTVQPPAPSEGGGGAGGGFGQPADSGGGQIPDEPVQPTVPTEPVQPAQPTEPTQPAQPIEPSPGVEQPVIIISPTPTEQSPQPTPVNTPVVSSQSLIESLDEPEIVFVLEENSADSGSISEDIYALQTNKTEKQLSFSCNYGSFSGTYGINITQNSDADGDGLSDQFECLAQTDPTEFDTDNDGFSDAYEELTLGTDPRQSNDKLEGAVLLITTPEDNMLTGDDSPLIKGINTAGGDVDIYIFARADFEDISQRIIAELEADENLNDLQKAEIYKRKFTIAVQDILAKFISDQLDPQIPDEAKFIDRVQLLGTAMTANNEIFLLESEKTLVDNTYLAMANNGNIFSKEVAFKVDRSLKVLNPDVSSLGNKPVPLEALLGELKVRIDPGNFRPILAGSIREPSKVVANWQSDIVSSALIADSLDDDFRLAAPTDLEPGEHAVYVTAYRRSDGAQSETLKIPFTIAEEEVQVDQVNWWGYILMGGGVAIIGVGIVFLRKRKTESLAA